MLNMFTLKEAKGWRTFLAKRSLNMIRIHKKINETIEVESGVLTAKNNSAHTRRHMCRHFVRQS